jgi:hypothetical protein
MSQPLSLTGEGGIVMALGRIVRRLVFAGVIVAAGGFAEMHSGAIRDFYNGVYPSDPAMREALEVCFMQDHKFNRLDADSREACYRRAMVPVETSSRDGGLARQAAAAMNAVDLRRAAGEGSLPRNDVRRTEQMKAALHLPQ